MNDQVDDVLVSLEAATTQAWKPYHAKEWPEALRRWEAIRNHWPNYAPGYVHSAAVLWELGQREDCVAALRHAHERVPSDPQIVTRLAEALTRLDQYEAASRLLEEAVPRFPYGPEVAIMHLKIAHERQDSAEVLRRSAVVARTHPDLLVTNEGVRHFMVEARRRLEVEPDTDTGGLWGDPLLYDPAKIMLAFESLGENCEFGLVQRHFGVEPLGLMRWTATSPGSLIKALDESFDGVGTPECTRLIESGPDYATAHRVYGMGSHTFVPVDREREAEIYSDQIRRLSYLRKKLIEDLEDGDKTFVYHLEKPMTEREMISVHRAVRRYGTTYLLYARLADDQNAPGTVRDLGRGLLVGYLTHLGPERRADGHSWHRLAFEEWLKVCRLAYLIRRRQEKLS